MKGKAIARYNLTGFLLATLLTLTVSGMGDSTTTEWSYQQFLQAVEQGNVEAITIAADRSQATITTQDGKLVHVDIPANDPELIDVLSQEGIQITVESGVENDGLLIRSLVPLLIFIFLLIFQVFWIWVLVDCAMKEANEGNTKIVWVIIILFANLLGALIYFFIRRPERRRTLGR